MADNPYYALTGHDGSFTITDVPPGNYTLVAFQPFTGPVQQPVTGAGASRGVGFDRAEEDRRL